jgi:hypothetical protein
MGANMANLFWKRKTGRAVNLLPHPFSSEEEFERAIFETQGLLSDVYPLRRQVRGGKKAGIPDIIGVDSDGNVCIIEMKNVQVDIGILPQVLQYAIWAEANPDSIKSLWLETPAPPEDVSISFDEYGVRVIIIAPSIDRWTVNLAQKIDYQVEFIEVNRWTEGEDEFLVVNAIEPEQSSKVKPVHALQVYDRSFYEGHYNKESVEQFLRIAEATNNVVRKHGWPLEPKFNKHYCGFKFGAFNAFGIKWLGTRSFAFFFKLSPADAQRFAPQAAPMTRYDEQFKEANFKIHPGVTDVESFTPLFRAAFEKLKGGGELALPQDDR